MCVRAARDAAAGVINEEGGTAAFIEAMFLGLAKGAASRQVVAAAAAAIFRCSAEYGKCQSEIEGLVQDRLGLIAKALHAQVAVGLATGTNFHSASSIVHPSTLLRANAAKHHGFQNRELLSEVPDRELRKRKRGSRRRPAAGGGNKHEDMEAQAETIPMDPVDDGGDTDMDQTEADTTKEVEAVANPNTGHQASSRTTDHTQAETDTKELKAEVFLQAAQHQQEGKLEKTVNDYNKVTTVGTLVAAEPARLAAWLASFSAPSPAEERAEAVARARVSATLAKDREARFNTR